MRRGACAKTARVAGCDSHMSQIHAAASLLLANYFYLRDMMALLKKTEIKPTFAKNSMVVGQGGMGCGGWL